jgi:hypothetical protein
MSVCVSICMEQLVSHRMDFHEMWLLEYFLKIYKKNLKLIKILQENWVI